MGFENPSDKKEAPSEAYEEETKQEVEKTLSEAREIDRQILELQAKKRMLLDHAGTIGGKETFDKVNEEFYGITEEGEKKKLEEWERDKKEKAASAFR